mgnify:CR=1 FL=1
MEGIEEKIKSISQELSLLQLNYLARFDVIEKSVVVAKAGCGCEILEQRVKTLETARQNQIILNQTFATKPTKDSLSVPDRKSFWDFFR